MSSSSVQDKLDKVPPVGIDAAGRFKYILIKVYVTTDPAKSPAKEQFKYVVRGYADCPYHGKVQQFNWSVIKIKEDGLTV